MKIVGGCYWETCESPSWGELMGSGGRAATVLADLVPSPIELHTYFPVLHRHELKKIEASGALVFSTATRNRYAFSYFYPLGVPVRFPADGNERSKTNHLTVTGEVVLRFSMLDGDARVAASCAIYDPQGSRPYISFQENGSTAEKLAIVLNEQEILSATEESEVAPSASKLLKRENAEVVVVKRGAKGALVFDATGQVADIHPYLSERVFKIGSGDVFSAAFSYYWGVAHLSPTDSARLASKSVASYCNNPRSPLQDMRSAVGNAMDAAITHSEEIRVLGSQRTLSDKWLLEEAKWQLEGLGFRARPASIGDISSLAGTPVLLLVDGLLRDEKWNDAISGVLTRCIAFSEVATGVRGEQGVRWTDDFTTAIYLVCWV